jgi:tetratricopeptide (TPR) repeat protein
LLATAVAVTLAMHEELCMNRMFHWLAALCGALLMAAAAAAAPEPPDVATIIPRHIEARGGAETMRAIENLMFEKGQYEEPGYHGSGDATMTLARPYYKLVGYPGRSKDLMEGYNGAAWEWYAEPGFVLWTTGAASEASRHYADVDGPFLDYQAKGYTAKLVGAAEIDGRPAWEVELTMPDGYESDNFFDQKSYLLVASGQTAKVHAFGAKVPSRTRFSDFRPVAGVLFPFRSSEVEIATGKELNAMQWGSITANRDIPTSWFSPPEFERKPIQVLIEQLYGQREDPAAVLWTYRVYRLAHPGEDTSDAAQIAGYQSLKMGQAKSAIALLGANARDYPDKPDAAFGLGRAYATAGREAEARAEFRRALTLDPKHSRAADALKALDTPRPAPQ